MKLLIQRTCDYADEFDTDGFLIMTQEEWDETLETAKYLFEKKQGPIEKYFGTNEYIEFSSFDEYKDSFTVSILPDRDAYVLEKHLGKSFGTVLLIE